MAHMASPADGLPSHALLLVRASTRLKPIIALSRMASNLMAAARHDESSHSKVLQSGRHALASRPAVLRI